MSQFQVLAKLKTPTIPVREFSLQEQDGTDHINVNKTATTSLGRCLTHEAEIPFQLPNDDTVFNSVHHYWQWLVTPVQMLEEGRILLPSENATLGVRVRDFIPRVLMASYYKVMTYEHLVKAISESELPFEHYYYYRDLARKAESDVTPEEGKKALFSRRRHKAATWIIPGMEEIRAAVKANRLPDFSGIEHPARGAAATRRNVSLPRDLAREIAKKFAG